MNGHTARLDCQIARDVAWKEHMKRVPRDVGESGRRQLHASADQFPFGWMIVICEVVIIKLSLCRCDKDLMEDRTSRLLRQLMKTNACVMTLVLSVRAVTVALTFLVYIGVHLFLLVRHPASFS